MGPRAGARAPSGRAGRGRKRSRWAGRSGRPAPARRRPRTRSFPAPPGARGQVLAVVQITRIHSDTHMLAHASCGCATRVTAMRTGRHIQGRDTGHLPPAGPRSGARSTSRNAEAHDDSTTLRHHSATKTQCTWHVARGGGGEKTESTGRSRSRQARCRTLRRAGSATSCRSKWRPSRAVLWTTAAGSPPTQRSRRGSGR